MMASLRSQLATIRDELFPRRMCAKKKRYATVGYAYLILKRREHLADSPLYVYRCPECGGFHLTKMQPPEHLAA